MSNVLRVKFGDETRIVSKPLYQYDYGQTLKFIDLELPASYEVHFSNYEHGDSTTTVATTNEVAIPDTYLQSGLKIYAWVYLHTGNNDGETEYMVTIPVIERATITNETPTPQEASAVSQAIAALNSAVTSISTYTNTASSAATTAENAREGARGYMEITEGYKNTASDILSQIQNSAGLGYITIGSTQLTEEDLIKLLALIEE